MPMTQLTFFCHFAADSTPPGKLCEIPSLLQEYKNFLATRKFDEAEKTNKVIHSLITNEISTTGDELRRFATELLNAGRYEESIPVYFAAAFLYTKEDLWGMRYCVGVGWDGHGSAGILGASLKMIGRDVAMKEVVKCHVIPLMHDVKNQMLEMTSVSEKDKSWWMSQVLERIARSAKLVDDDEAAKEALKESRVWKEKWWQIEEEERKPWWKKISDAL